MTIRGPWALFESPESSASFEKLLEALTGKLQGIFLRYGTGLDPLVLLDRIKAANLETGLYLHFRDMNRTALISVLKTAHELGIRRIILGDPFPVRQVLPIGAADGPRFLEYVRELFGSGFSFGSCFLMTHPADQHLFDRYQKAGLDFALVPPEALPIIAGKIKETWIWERTGQMDHLRGRGEHLLLDFTDLGDANHEQVRQHLQTLTGKA